MKGRESMSSYHSSFEYLQQKSTDFGWIISHFDPDNGETDSYLSQEQIYSESYNGTKRILYGTKYNSVANVKITVVKQDGGDFTLQDCRNAYKWLTGNPEANWMNLYIGDDVKYRLLCTIQDVKPQKMDARTIGLNIYCESLSPWAYSPLEQKTFYLPDCGPNITINCPSDDLYSFVYAKTTYINGTTDSVEIKYNTLKNSKPTIITGLGENEKVTLDSNMMIYSDSGTLFGNSFNFEWPRFQSGVNELVVTGDGEITFEYYYPVKMGDCATNINIVRDPICDDYGNIQVDTLPWHRVSDTPETLKGYGITDSYTKNEIDFKLENVVTDDVYTKQEIDDMLEDVSVGNVYTKPEIDEKITILESKLADLMYENIAITSISNNINSVDNGRVIDEVKIQWATNRIPVAIVLGNNTLDPTLTEYSYYNVSTDQTWKLTITGEHGEIVDFIINSQGSKTPATTGVTFLNRVYYGAAEEPTEYDRDFILSLSGKTLSRTKVSPVNITTGSGQYMYYCLPVSMGTCTFTVGGFVGGFTKVKENFMFENQYNHKELYDIYRSDYPNLGLQKVLVT